MQGKLSDLSVTWTVVLKSMLLNEETLIKNWTQILEWVIPLYWKRHG